jgi:fatty acid desaturase
MGEAKRRAEQGLPPRPRAERPAGQPKAKPKDTSPRIASWLPLTQKQGEQFVQITTRGAWIGIAALVVFWVTVRFVGPAAGWWTLADG